MATNNIIGLIYFGFINLFILVQISNSLSLGSISGDVKRSSSPLIIKKTSDNSPIIINIRPGIKSQILITRISPNKLNLKTPHTRIKKSIRTPITSSKLLKLPKLPKLSKLPKVPKLPKLPKLPILPILPPLLPPIIPKLPLLPIPLLPLLPPVPLLPPPPLPIIPCSKKLKKPIRVPILGKTKLQKALVSELKPLKLASSKSLLNKKILEKLMKLKKDGSLTTSQFMRFKKLLL